MLRLGKSASRSAPVIRFINRSTAAPSKADACGVLLNRRDGRPQDIPFCI